MRLIARVTSIALLSLTVAGVFAASGRAADDGGVARDPQIGGPTRIGSGVWRTKVQQVFDPASRTLSRRLYALWDPAQRDDQDFMWTPNNPPDDKAGRIDGTGLLVWRLKSRPSYDANAIVAQYRGEVHDGRIGGHGVYLDSAGLYYVGGWKAGLMNGRGTLKLPSGEEYVGQFRNGLANGTGHLIDITGESYQGPFVNGYRHGRGMTELPNGSTYESQWTDGKERETSRLIRLAQAAGAPIPGGADDIRIGITIDKRLPQSSRDDVSELRKGDLLYSISNDAKGLLIRPDNKRLLAMWRGRDPVQLAPSEEDPASDYYGVFSLSRRQLLPLKLNIEVQNRTSSEININGVYLDISKSVTDLQPAIQMSQVSAFDVKNQSVSSVESLIYRPFYYIENFGWSLAKRAKLQFSFVDPQANAPDPANRITHEIGQIERSVTLNFEPYLQRAGVDIAALKQHVGGGFPCAGRSRPNCLANIKGRGVFGRLSGLIALDETYLTIKLSGKLEYSWSGGTDGENNVSSPFTIALRLGELKQEAEIGEMGFREIVSTKTQSLKLDASNYRIPISYQTKLSPGRTARLILPIDAAKSSGHEFKVAVQLSDGREIKSRMVDLLYFRPRWFADALRTVSDPEDQADISNRNYYELSGADLRQTKPLKSSQCTEACEANPSCKAYTEDKWNGTCVLKSSAVGLRFDPQFLSWFKEGTRIPQVSSEPKLMDRLPSSAFSGFGYWIVQSSNLNECTDRCHADKLCIAMTFMKSQGNCYLYNVLEGAPAPNSDGESALKRQFPR